VQPVPPWAAYISIGDSTKVIIGLTDNTCTGIIVSAHWVLTANHCVRDDTGSLLPASDFHVIVGRTTITDTGEGKDLPVAHIDRYTPFDRAYVTGDVALLEIAGTLPASARPLPLAPSGYPVTPGTAVTEYGYGYQLEKYDGTGHPIETVRSHELRKTVPGSYTAAASCGSSVPANEKSLVECFAKAASAPSQTSQGDSGGPWVTSTADPFIIGVDSQILDFDTKTNLYNTTKSASVADPSIHSWITAKERADILQGVTGDIYLDKGTGAAWLMEGDGFRHVIKSDAVYGCLVNAGAKVQTPDAFDLAELPVSPSSPATCTPRPASWAVSELAVPTDDTGYNLQSVSQLSCGTVCAAAGIAIGGPLDAYRQIVFWTLAGSTWKPTVAPLPDDASADATPTLSQLSCGGGNCAASGSYLNQADNVEQVLWSFTGSTWTATEAVVPSGVSASSRAELLVGPSCGPAGLCAEAGAYLTSSGYLAPLMWTLNGSGWAETRPSLPTGANTGRAAAPLESVSCGTGICAAFGTYLDTHGNTQGVFWTSAGSGWTPAQVPLLPGASSPFGNSAYAGATLSCAIQMCAATGLEVLTNSTLRSAWFRLNPAESTRWQVYEPPAADSGAWDISCGSSTCAAMDYLQKLAVWARPAWKISTPKLPAGNLAAVVSSLSCGSECAAGGGSQGPTAGTFWDLDGSVWTTTSAPAPNGAPAGAYVSQVSCGTPAPCAAIGDFLTSANATPGLLWTGSDGSWTLSPLKFPADATSSPNPQFARVSCGTGVCAASGTYYNTSYRGNAVWVTHP
jgi:hypothetical protein